MGSLKAFSSSTLRDTFLAVTSVVNVVALLPARICHPVCAIGPNGDAYDVRRKRRGGS